MRSIAAVLCAFGSLSRAPDAASAGNASLHRLLGRVNNCASLHDVARKSRNMNPGRPRYDLFVAGTEGSGHHGAVHGFLSPLLAEAAGVDEKQCVKNTEMPFYAGYDADRRQCPTAAAIGWESFPSKRRVFEAERLSLLYASPRCFDDPNALKGRYPGKWRAVAPTDACYRCGSWADTLNDAFARHLASDRLDVYAFQASVPSLRVIFLVREFSHSVFSHAPWDGGGRGHAMMLALHLAALARDAARMPATTWRALRYELLDDRVAYVDAAAAVAALINLTDSAGVRLPDVALRSVAAAVRDARWRPPSLKHDSLANADTPETRAVREVEAAWSHRWAIFHRPDVQLIPTQNASGPPPATAPVVVAPRNATAVPTCQPPRLEPCRRCVSRPALDGPDVARWCGGRPPVSAKCCVPKI